jgi:hypothetical protein
LERQKEENERPHFVLERVAFEPETIEIGRPKIAEDEGGKNMSEIQTVRISVLKALV